MDGADYKRVASARNEDGSNLPLRDSE